VTWDDGSSDNPRRIDEEGFYSVVVINTDGCVGLGAIEVVENCGTVLIAPNAFTPDGDGRNDRFRVFGEDLLSFELSVFDRWGNVLYRSLDPAKGWDGTTGGIPLEMGAYIWQARFRDAVRPDLLRVQSGSVTILR
jgi:gliding motility-associated-like protein